MRAIVITGGRNTKPTKDELEALLRWCGDVLGDDYVLIHGDCRGVDKIVGAFFEGKGIHVLRVPALWGPLGKGAGFYRNMRMCEVGRAIDRHGVCVPWPGGNGTESCKRTAKLHGLEIHPIAEIVERYA